MDYERLTLTNGVVKAHAQGRFHQSYLKSQGKFVANIE